MADFFTPSRGSYDPSFANESDGNSFAGLAPPSAAPAGPTVAPVGFDEVSRQVFVNGRTFNADDHASALESVADLDKPLQPMPSNFRPMSPSEYGGYINRIKDPSLKRLASKNLGIGVDVSQQLAGSALKFLGAEETGQAIIDQQEEDIGFNQPYQRNFTDIDSAGGVGDWFVANAAQMAPLMAEMIITSALTGGVGGVAAGTARGSRFLAKGATKKAAKAGVGPTIKQAEANAAIRARDAIKKGLKPDVEDMKALRKAGRIGGAKLGAVAAAEGVAIGDIYQAVEESGNYDSPTLAWLVTAVASVPYAAAEVLPAFVAAKTIFGKGGKSFLTKGGRAKRGAIGFGVGGGLEGSTEAFQEIVSLGAAGELDFGDPEVRNQLINAFAAGAGVGAPIGTLSNIVKSTPEEKKPVDTEKENANILNPEQVLQLTDQREPLALEAPRLQLEAPNIGGATAIKIPGIIEERFGPGAIAGFEAQRASIQRELDDPNINEERRQDAQSELDSIASILEAIRRQRRGEQAIFQEGPLGITSGDPTTFEGTDPANIVGPDQRQAAEMETNIQSALAQQAAQQAAQQTRQLPVVPTRGTPVQPTGLPPVVAQSDLTATPFALDALELSRAQEPEVIRRQNQEFDEMEAALADQQQGDIRLQEQLPLPTPRQPLRRSPLLKASDEPTLLVERVVDGRSVVEPVPVEEVYQQSATEMQAIMRLQRCLQKSL